MEHELKPGAWCLPSTQNEWFAVINTARHLDVWNGRDDRWGDQAAIQMFTGGSIGRSNWTVHGVSAIPCSAFIAGMYAMAEKRKASPPPEPQAGGIPTAKEQKDLSQLAEFVDWLSMKESARYDLLKETVSNLETALNEHMVACRKHTHAIDKGGGFFTSTLEPEAAGAGDQVTPTFEVFDHLDTGRNMPFEAALVHLKAGRRVRRSHWKCTMGMSNIGFVYFLKGSFPDTVHDLSYDKIMATDWQVVSEP